LKRVLESLNIVKVGQTIMSLNPALCNQSNHLNQQMTLSVL
jgi:hypothetical protein